MKKQRTSSSGNRLLISNFENPTDVKNYGNLLLGVCNNLIEK